MKKIMVLGFALLILLSILPMGVIGSAQGKVPVIIMFKERQDLNLVRNLGGRVNIVYRFQPAVAAVIPMQAVDALSENPAVEYVVPDLPIELVDDTLPWGVERIGAPAVHAAGNKGTGINVAVLDTGIDTDHPDLSYVYGYDFSGDNDPDPEDFDGHGTHVAGIVAALDNNIGVIGVAPDADLYILKIFTDDGSGSYSDAVEAIEWCIGTYSDGVSGNDIQVISMSWGSKKQQGNPGIEPWINQAYELGILLIGAAGNEGNPRGVGDNVIYPARYENAVAVAATDDTDTRAWWSSTGPAVELAAPGVSIFSTYLDGGYTTMSGTSMACPHVSGTAALVLASSVDSDYDFDGDGVWDNDEVRKKLQDTADDLGDPGRDSKYGYGLVDADEACGVTPTPVGNLDGYVTDSTDGSAIKEATVTVVGTTKSATTDSSGYYLIEEIPEGTYDVTAEASGYESQTQSVKITADTTTRLDFSLDPAPSPSGTMHIESIDFKQKGPRWLDIMVTIYDDTGSPVTGATVYMDITYPDGSVHSVSAVTNGKGIATYQISRPAKGTYTVTVTNVTHDTLTYDLDANKETTDSYTVT